MDGKTRVGLFAKRAIEQGEELLAYYGPECRNLFNAETRNSQTSQVVQALRGEIVDADPRVTEVRQSAKYSNQSSFSPPSALHQKPQESMSMHSRIGRSLTDPHFPTSGKYSVRDKSTVAKIDSTSFQLIPKVKHPYYSIKPEKKWKSSRCFEELHSKYRALVINLRQLRDLSTWGASEALRFPHNSRI